MIGSQSIQQQKKPFPASIYNQVYTTQDGFCLFVHMSKEITLSVDSAAANVTAPEHHRARSVFKRQE